MKFITIHSTILASRALSSSFNSSESLWTVQRTQGPTSSPEPTASTIIDTSRWDTWSTWSNVDSESSSIWDEWIMWSPSILYPSTTSRVLEAPTWSLSAVTSVATPTWTDLSTAPFSPSRSLSAFTRSKGNMWTSSGVISTSTSRRTQITSFPAISKSTSTFSTHEKSITALSPSSSKSSISSSDRWQIWSSVSTLRQLTITIVPVGPTGVLPYRPQITSFPSNLSIPPAQVGVASCKNHSAMTTFLMKFMLFFLLGGWLAI